MVPTEKATEPEDSPSASGLLMMLVTLPAMVISRPSRIHATPRAMTRRVWNRDHPIRSIRAGTRDRIGDVGVACELSATVLAIGHLLKGDGPIPLHRRRLHQQSPVYGELI